MNTQISFIVSLLNNHFQSTQIQVVPPNIFVKVDDIVRIQLSVLEKEVLVSTMGTFYFSSKNRMDLIKMAMADIEAILLASNIRYFIIQRNSATN